MCHGTDSVNCMLSVAWFAQDMYSEFLVRMTGMHLFLTLSPFDSVGGSWYCNGIEQERYFRVPDT